MKTITANWYETKIKYDKTMEDGTERKVIETYVVDAMSCMEAESRVLEWLKPFIQGESKVVKAGEANYNEIVFAESSDAEKFYKAKVKLITMNENGAEKQQSVTFLVQASSLREALKNIEELFKNSIMDYSVVGLDETKVVDVLSVAGKDGNKEEKE